MLHGRGNHSTEDCITLKNQAKKMKEDGGSSKGSSSYKSKNKSWKKDDNFRKAVKEEVKLMIASGSFGDLNAINESKRKSSDDDDDSASYHSTASKESVESNGSEHSLNVLQKEMDDLEFGKTE